MLQPPLERAERHDEAPEEGADFESMAIFQTRSDEGI